MTTHSSSWEPNLNSGNSSYQSDSSTFLPPLPKINLHQSEPNQNQDISLSNLLPEFFEDGATQAQPSPKAENLYDYGTITEPVSPKPANPSELEQSEESPILANTDTSRMYAWLEQQEHQEEHQQVNQERKQLLIKLGAIIIVVALIAIFLILNVLTPAPTSPKILIAGELSPYPGAANIEVPAKMNEDIQQAFLKTQKPAPTSAEAYYFLSPDPATKILEFYNQDMAAKAYKNPVLIDDFLQTAPGTKTLNARGVSYTNATPQGYAVVAVPVTSALATSLGGNAKVGDTLLAILSIKS